MSFRNIVIGTCERGSHKGTLSVEKSEKKESFKTIKVQWGIIPN